jgi:uncharacterized protein YjbJ (UPF0337 family)
MGAITDKLKGKMKKAEGRVTGDRAREAQGNVQEKKGAIEGAVQRVKTRAKAKINQARAKRQVKRASRAR